MAAVTLHSDFGAQENKVCHCFHFSPIYFSWSDGTGCHDLSFWNAEFSASFFILFLHLDQEALQFLFTFCLSVQFSSVALSCPTVCDPITAACQASLSITNSRSSLRLMSIESVMPCSHLILCHPFLLLPPIPPSIRVFYNESTLRMRWPKY